MLYLIDVDGVFDDEMKVDDYYPFQWHCHLPYHYHYRSDQDVLIPSYEESIF
jgi:hypothetical protein